MEHATLAVEHSYGIFVPRYPAPKVLVQEYRCPTNIQGGFKFSAGTVE